MYGYRKRKKTVKTNTETFINRIVTAIIVIYVTITIVSISEISDLLQFQSFYIKHPLNPYLYS